MIKTLWWKKKYMRNWNIIYCQIYSGWGKNLINENRNCKEVKVPRNNENLIILYIHKKDIVHIIICCLIFREGVSNDTHNPFFRHTNSHNLNVDMYIQKIFTYPHNENFNQRVSINNLWTRVVLPLVERGFSTTFLILYHFYMKRYKNNIY